MVLFSASSFFFVLLRRFSPGSPGADPAEVNKLKAEVAKLKAEVEEVASLREQCETYEEESVDLLL